LRAYSLERIGAEMAGKLRHWQGMSSSRIVSVFMALCSLPGMAQIATGRPAMKPVPPSPRKVAVPVSSTRHADWMPDQQRRLTPLMKKLSGKQRRKLARAINHMTPEQRQQFIALLKQQLGKAPRAPKRGK